MSRTRWIAVALVGLVVAAALIFTEDRDGGQALSTDGVSRLLVVSMPGVAWSDVERGLMPTLEAFARDAAIGDMSTRIGRRNATATDAYLTIGSGTRAKAPSIDVAVAVDPGDRYGGVPTGEILQRRLGTTTFEGIAYLAVGAARDVNRRSVFGAEVGLLGQSLAEAGVGRAVIANADAIEGFLDEARPPDGYYARSAVTALMDDAGIVPAGAVGRNLLVDDPAAAFGTRLDIDAVVDQFDQVWNRDRNVVMVEASDLSRVAAYRPLTTSEQRRVLRDDALASADRLLARLLASVDPDRDAVMVISPVSARAQPALGIAAVRAPGVDAGYLESATTRRTGYVQLADVTPTVLGLMGEEFPTEIEGRAFHVVDDGTHDRIQTLIDSADAARFRDDFLPTVVTVIVIAVALVLAAGLGRNRLPKFAQIAVRPAAYATLGLVPGTFLASRFSFAHASRGGHWLVIAGVAVALAVTASGLGRIDRRGGVVFAVGFTVVLLVGDVIGGANLQMNTVFGYSVAVAGRFTGLGNLAYALLGSAAIVLAVLIFDLRGPRSLPFVVVLLTVVVLADGLPMVGADVGGVISLIPAFGVTVLVMLGRRVRAKHLIALFAGAATTVFVFAFIDAGRPEGAHTHLARLADHVLEGRWDVLANIVNRRWQASFGSLELAGLGTVLVALVAAIVYSEVQLRRVSGRVDRPKGNQFPRRSLEAIDAQPVSIRAGMAGIGVLAVVGMAVNDSSIAVPLTALIVALPAYVAHKLTEVVPA